MNGKEMRNETRIITPRTVVLIIVLVVVCVALTTLLQFKEITDLDVWLFQEAREKYETDLKSFMRAFTELGSILVWIPVVPLLWLIHRKKEATTLFIALLTVVVFAASMKYAIDRPRPYDVILAVDPLYRPLDPSFPSAHAMTVFAGAMAIGTKWRKMLIPLLALAVAVGFSRVYIGVHFPFDIVSGALIGILIGLLADSLNLSRMIQWLELRVQSIARKLGLYPGTS